MIFSRISFILAWAVDAQTPSSSASLRRLRSSAYIKIIRLSGSGRPYMICLILFIIGSSSENILSLGWYVWSIVAMFIESFEVFLFIFGVVR